MTGSWFCLQVAPQREISTAWALGETGTGVYCPTRWFYRARRGAMARAKKDPIRQAYPLLSGYLFAQADSDSDLFAKLAAIQVRDGLSVEELREALTGYGEDIDDIRLARAARQHWHGTHVRSVLTSGSGAPIVIPQGVIDKIVTLENKLRFVPGPPIMLILAIGDRVVTLGGETGTVAKSPRQGKVKLDCESGRQTVPVASVRLAA